MSCIHAGTLVHSRRCNVLSFVHDYGSSGWPGHLGVENLNVVRSSARLLNHGSLSKPLPLVKDGDQVVVVQHLIITRGLVLSKLHRLRVMPLRLMLNRVECGRRTGLGIWRLILQLTQVEGISLRRSWTAPDPLVWDQGGWAKQRNVNIRINVDFATLLGTPGFLCRPWVQICGGCITGADVAAWPYSVTLLCECSSLVGSLHWPADTGDLRHYGVSYLEVLILFEQWADHRLLSEKVIRHHVRAHRPISVSSVLVSEGIKILQGVVSLVVWSELLATFMKVFAMW